MRVVGGVQGLRPPAQLDSIHYLIGRGCVYSVGLVPRGPEVQRVFVGRMAGSGALCPLAVGGKTDSVGRDVLEDLVELQDFLESATGWTLHIDKGGLAYSGSHVDQVAVYCRAEIGL